jgi:hypothetical protein
MTVEENQAHQDQPGLLGPPKYPVVGMCVIRLSSPGAHLSRGQQVIAQLPAKEGTYRILHVA